MMAPAPAPTATMISNISDCVVSFVVVEVVSVFVEEVVVLVVVVVVVVVIVVVVVVVDSSVTVIRTVSTRLYPNSLTTRRVRL